MTRLEMGRVLRFGVVGLAATAVHAAVLGLGLHAGLSPSLANACAFCVAVWCTYWGQRLWVFGRPPRSLVHFLAVALLGLVLHAGGMPALRAMGAGVWPAWMALTVLVPAVTFVAARFWAFSTPRRSG